MSATKNRSISSQQNSNSSDIRKKIITSTALQQQGHHEPQPFFAQLSRGAKESRTQDVRESSDRNMKFKLEQLGQRLQELQAEVRSTRQENRELVELASLLKQNLVYEDLYGLKAELDRNINGFSTYIRAIKASSQERYGQIYNDCSELWKRTQELREHVFNLSMRVERLEEKMGFQQDYRLQNY